MVFEYCQECNKFEICQKLGHKNRNGERKMFCCNCYLNTEHKKRFNPKFSEKDYCYRCKKYYLVK